MLCTVAEGHIQPMAGMVWDPYWVAVKLYHTVTARSPITAVLSPYLGQPPKTT